jgi:hypothetical protein
MSGYERSDSSPVFPERPEEEREDSGRLWPEDFSPEEKRFADELRELFPIEDEVLPPLYVQTLLDDELRAPLGRGYTRKLIYRVMRRLDLPTRPLTPRRGFLGLPEGTTLRSVTEPVRRAGTPVIAALSLLMALVLGTVYLATPSFAEGLRLLLGQTGAQQLESYPANVADASHPVKPRTQASAAMPMFWLGPALGRYSYIGMGLLDQQDWSNGQVLDIQYSLTQPAIQEQAQTGANDANSASGTGDANSVSGASGQKPGAQTSGSGLLDIREFQVSNAYSAVLLVVQDGSATMTSVNGQPAVYVDGMWVVTQGGRKMWQRGTRSMLIFERDGVIFWITGDQRDGMTEYPLTRIAAALTPTSLTTLRPNRLTTRLTGVDPDANLREPLGVNTDVLDVIARGDGERAPASKFVTLSMPALNLMN